MRLEDHIQDIPDFPKPGIVFKDITPLFLDAEALRQAVDEIAGWAREWEIEYVVSAEARGFVLGAAVAVAANAGFILARKPCTTTCSRPAARPARCATWWSRRAESWQDARS